MRSSSREETDAASTRIALYQRIAALADEVGHREIARLAAEAQAAYRSAVSEAARWHAFDVAKGLGYEDLAEAVRLGLPVDLPPGVAEPALAQALAAWRSVAQVRHMPLD